MESEFQYWRKAIDSRTSKVYYYNKLTRETRWDPPFGEDSAKKIVSRGVYQSSPSNALSSMNTSHQSHKSRNGSEGQSTGGSSSSYMEIMSPARVEALQFDIKEAVDERTGKTYYYDRKTRIAYWHDPRLQFIDQELEIVKKNVKEDELLSSNGDDSVYEEIEEEEEEEDDAGLMSFLREETNAFEEASKMDDLNFDDIQYDDMIEESYEPTNKDTQEQLNEFYNDETEIVEEEPGNVSLEKVRSSLVLLKKRIKHPIKQAAEPPRAPPPPLRVSTTTKPIVKKQAKRGPSQRCTRQSGCECDACVRGYTMDLKVNDDNNLEECGNCGRRFNHDSLQVHTKVCAKVFNVSAKTKKKSKTKTIGKENLVKTGGSSADVKQTTWRKKSLQLRQALKANSGKQGDDVLAATYGNTMGSLDGMDLDDDLVPCPHCNRTFNPKAAERHIPKCTQIRAKPKVLLRGSGKGAYSTLKPNPLNNNNNNNNNNYHAFSNTSDLTSPMQVSPPSRRSRTFSGAVPTRSASPRRNGLHRVSVTKSGITRQECPHCNRSFGKKAYDRHLEHCASVKAKRDTRLSLNASSNKASNNKSKRRASEPFLLDHPDDVDYHHDIGDHGGDDDVDIDMEMLIRAAAESNVSLDYLFRNGGPYEFVPTRDSLAYN